MNILIDFYQQLPGSRINVKFLNADLFPLYIFRNDLKRIGIILRFKLIKDFQKSDHAPVACIDSRCFLGKTLTIGDGISFLKMIRNHYDFIVWFDNRDSTGTTQFEVLPYVDRYCKKQLLIDRELYQANYIGNRVYTDYYFRNYSIEDQDNEGPQVQLDINYINKLALSWNLGYSDYRSVGRLDKYLWNALKKSYPRFVAAFDFLTRCIDINARYSINHGLNSIKYHRQRYLDICHDIRLEGYDVRTGKIDKPSYRRELIDSKITLSPFGWGEICYRDFEAFIHGNALIKPNMNHLETWPNLFMDYSTYVPIDWDFRPAQKQLREALCDEELLASVAATGYERYRSVWSRTGINDFCKHFVKIVSN